ncbi:hypothetical protein [Moraxella bovis]|uniref:Uncharacterized protein n=1 Tax=Moraxella bovis TaxID=476 RepID=A0AAQ2QAL5_MORBO|nr:hypothetical protein [Moraxella bovis]UYZ76195.1 hypothetical protein LP093_02395 [Moraxella bovis]UYZ77851.1 hypothetical protein LP115_11400 [Moraxella bovis]UYZ80746.1 hypothetical protein LP113_12080 [Moraxella bovis]UYZ86337.1 hypothetical protein LP094_11450 [Moraxella bovis]UYZ89016.1 hypothetical protein LP114_11400 [Moraxella bovis]
MGLIINANITADRNYLQTVERACLPFVFAMKNVCLKKQGNRPFFKEKNAGCEFLSSKFLAMKSNLTT